MVWSKDQERKVYEFRSKLYGDTLNRWMENYPDPPSDKIYLFRLYGKKPFVTKKPSASYMEWGGGPPPISISDWILATGFWNDNGFWRDNAVWID